MVGHGVELIVLPVCNNIFQAPAVCLSIALIAHETTEAIVDNGLLVGVTSIFDGAVFKGIDCYKLTTQIGGLLGIKLLVCPLDLLKDTVLSFSATLAIGAAYDYYTNNDHIEFAGDFNDYPVHE